MSAGVAQVMTGVALTEGTSSQIASTVSLENKKSLSCEAYPTADTVILTVFELPGKVNFPRLYSPRGPVLVVVGFWPVAGSRSQPLEHVIIAPAIPTFVPDFKIFPLRVPLPSVNVLSARESAPRAVT